MNSWMSAAAAIAIMAIGREANATTYFGSQSFDGATVNLSITTDGAIGLVEQNDITDWNIVVTDSSGTADLTPSNSYVMDTGNHLLASPIHLRFGFSGQSGVLAFIGDGPSPPFYALSSQQFSLLCATYCQAAQATQGGPTEILDYATARRLNLATALPEPPSWVTMLLGLGAAGGVLRRRAKKTS